MYVKHNIEGL